MVCIKKTYVSSIICMFLIFISFGLYAQKKSETYEIGKTYFRTHCSSCHGVHEERYGPMLASISKKRNTGWLVSFIHNSQTVIKSGDLYANELFEKFNRQTMPSFEHLSEKDIEAILYYIEIESLQPGEYLNDSHMPAGSSEAVLNGKQEFLDHCSMCHFIHKESDFAPALGSVTKRHSREWLISFIRHSQGKIQGGDLYAIDLYNSFDKHLMTRMEFLDAEEINSILDYIEFESTVNVAYAGKINKDQYKKQAVALIKETSNKYNVVPIICFLISISMLLVMILQFYFLLNFINHSKK